ncbi:MAG TPA: ABC transporter substrate-binding protein [Streptosporangiaceae bacterium]|nr:ABC transporter substrate-binding protein [Streptosporangiaceae bacterium]
MRSVPAHQGRSRPRLYGRLLAVGAAALALVAAGCSSSSSPTSSGTTPVKGGTAVWAEQPSAPPTYIFPYVNSANISNTNLFDFQYLMYRPLYWFGQNGQPVVNNSLSLANQPTVSGNTLTITLKHYMWSNGQPVTATDVMFWLNMELAQPANYGAYTGFPANMTNIHVVSPTELQMTMTKAYSPTWVVYNDLSQVVPMPAAWDKTASGPSDCATKVSDCTAVYNYLAGQAKDLSTYATSPIWSIVDGPWRLSAFNADGHITFVPNKAYSGPIKPKLAAFQEVPFTTDSAEYDVLRSPSSSTKIDFGYLPDEDAPAKPANAAVGSNPLSGYTLAPLYPWGIDYYAINYQSTISDHAAIFKQLYFRQAMAYLMNQAAIISGPLRGYGAVTVGPVAATPPTKFLSATGRQGDPFPYNPGKAKSLLTSHGWSVAPGGTTTCTDPAKCGPGITQGSALSFTFQYESGVTWVNQEMTQLQSNAAALGIKLNLDPKPFAQVISVAGGNCVVVKAPCNWDMANWGFGWSFSPDYLPTGDQLFLCGAVANSGGYCDKTNDSMINQTLTNDSLPLFYNWQNYLAQQLPVEYAPQAAFTLTEVANNLKGVLPQSPTLSINPENWYFVK